MTQGVQETSKVAHQVVHSESKIKILTGARRWESKVFKRGGEREDREWQATVYSVRLAHDNRRAIVNLQTEDLREAARRANRFHRILKAQGWDAAHQDLAPDQGRRRIVSNSPTVGAVIAAAEELGQHASGKSLRQYASSLRWIAGQVAEIAGDASRFDYHNCGAQKWREAVDGVHIKALTTKAVEASVARYIASRDGTPEAKRTSASFIRQARALFSERMRRVLPFEVQDPFKGLMIDRARPPKYMPTFDSTALVASARAELRQDDPQAWLALLLCLAAGLRKGEADVLRWEHVDTAHGLVRVVSGKTVQSIGEIPVGMDTAQELERFRAAAAGPFVLEGEAINQKSTVREYRARATFDRLASWLRAHGVTDKKPLHALRKEAGSLVNAQAGIHAASRFLRHADIAVTAAHYADGRRRAVVGLFEKEEGAR